MGDLCILYPVDDHKGDYYEPASEFICALQGNRALPDRRGADDRGESRGLLWARADGAGSGESAAAAAGEYSVLGRGGDLRVFYEPEIRV